MDLARRQYAKLLAGEPIGSLEREWKEWASSVSAPDPVAVDDSFSAMIAASKSLSPISYQEQANDYYCGPASGWVVNKYVGNKYYGTTSSYKGESLTQQNLALAAYLATTTDGTGLGTNWMRGLNKWWDGTEAGWYALDYLACLQRLCRRADHRHILQLPACLGRAHASWRRASPRLPVGHRVLALCQCIRICQLWRQYPLCRFLLARAGKTHQLPLCQRSFSGR